MKAAATGRTQTPCALHQQYHDEHANNNDDNNNDDADDEADDEADEDSDVHDDDGGDDGDDDDGEVDGEDCQQEDYEISATHADALPRAAFGAVAHIQHIHIRSNCLFFELAVCRAYRNHETDSPMCNIGRSALVIASRPCHTEITLA